MNSAFFKLNTLFNFVFIFILAFSVQAQTIQSSEYRETPSASPPYNGVMYFFWDGAPHAYDLTPELSGWVNANPKIKFQMVPVAFREDFTPHSEIFYTFEELGRSDMNSKVMTAIHTQRKRLLTDDEIGEWVEGYGFSRQEFLARMKSPSVLAKVSNANQMTKTYGITGVPNFVVNGKYITGPAIAGSKQKTFQVIDSLLVNNPPLSTAKSGGARPGIDDYKNKCKELGFKMGTEEFGKCVLQLSK